MTATGSNSNSNLASGAISMGVGIAILGFGYEQLAHGGLRDDNSAIGWTVKIVFLMVGLAFVAIPLKAMFASSAKQKVYRKSLRQGIISSGQAARDEFGTVSRAAKSVARETSGAVAQLMSL